MNKSLAGCKNVPVFSVHFTAIGRFSRRKLVRCEQRLTSSLNRFLCAWSFQLSVIGNVCKRCCSVCSFLLIFFAPWPLQWQKEEQTHRLKEIVQLRSEWIRYASIQMKENSLLWDFFDSVFIFLSICLGVHYFHRSFCNVQFLFSRPSNANNIRAPITASNFAYELTVSSGSACTDWLLNFADAIALCKVSLQRARYKKRETI